MAGSAVRQGAWDAYRSKRSEGALPPHGQRFALAGRGEIFARTLDGPPDAHPLVLLHGWGASGGLNWFQAFAPLRRHFDVIAPDLRGHARGIRSFRPFRLAECADDIAALLDKLGKGPALIAGYSMGGPIAQLLWQRHPDKVAGLVMVATSAHPVRTEQGSRVFGGFMGSAALAGRIAEYTTWLPRRVASGAARLRDRPDRPGSLARWARAEMGRHSIRHLLEAGAELGRYDARPWIGNIDVPTAVVVTERDRAMPARFQLEMATGIPDATIHRVDSGHLSCVSSDFGHVVLDACRDVVSRLR